jgi:hypothetical protein
LTLQRSIDFLNREVAGFASQSNKQTIIRNNREALIRRGQWRSPPEVWSLADKFFDELKGFQRLLTTVSRAKRFFKYSTYSQLIIRAIENSEKYLEIVRKIVYCFGTELLPLRPQNYTLHIKEEMDEFHQNTILFLEDRIELHLFEFKNRE